MSTSTEPERGQQSFAETALRLGGKTEEEARRTGAVDQGRRAGRSPVRAAVSDRQQPRPQGGLGRQGAAGLCLRRRRYRPSAPCDAAMEASLEIAQTAA